MLSGSEVSLSGSTLAQLISAATDTETCGGTLPVAVVTGDAGADAESLPPQADRDRVTAAATTTAPIARTKPIFFMVCSISSATYIAPGMGAFKYGNVASK